MKRSNKTVSRKCAQCGQSFVTERRYLSRGPKVGTYCSRECRGLASRNRIDKTCETCGMSFQVPACQSSVRTCSSKCGGVIRRTAKTRTCQSCGTEFTIVPSQLKYYKGAGKYCSQKCAYDGMAKENALKPIKDKYGRSNRRAGREWQRAVREKDNYTCQRCGVYEKHVHTHHVAPRSQRPDLKYIVSNGKCLCNSCHSWVHNHPIEARQAGLLSGETYEMAQKQRNQECQQRESMLTSHQSSAL